MMARSHNLPVMFCCETYKVRMCVGMATDAILLALEQLSRAYACVFLDMLFRPA